MSTREEQKEQRRSEILNAGLDLFIRKGYTATKISDIAKEVHMSNGLLFHYFESKEKLYEELVRFGLEGTQKVMQFDSDNPILFFEIVANGIFQFIREQSSVAKIFLLMEQAGHNEAAPQSVKDMVAQVNNITQSIPLIEAGQKNGSIKEGNPMALSTAYWCSIQGIAQELAVHTDYPYPDPSWIVDILRK